MPRSYNPDPHLAAQARLSARFRTLLDTTDPFDAGVAGFDGPTDVCDGGVKVIYDGGGPQGEVEILTLDGRLYGAQLMGHVIDALNCARSLALAKERQNAP